MHPGRLNCISFARDRRDFVFAPRVNDRSGIFVAARGGEKRKKKLPKGKVDIADSRDCRLS